MSGEKKITGLIKVDLWSEWILYPYFNVADSIWAKQLLKSFDQRKTMIKRCIDAQPHI